MQMQLVIQIIIHVDVTPFLTHEQANQCKCAFVGGPFRKSYMKINMLHQGEEAAYTTSLL